MTEPQLSGGAIAPELIADLAAASRILAQQGVVDAMGHVSLRHPAAPDRFLMSRAMAPALVTPGDIMEFDLGSEAVAGDTRRGFLERFIHGEVYKARPDVMSVVHSHSPSVIPFGLVKTPVQAMFHNAAFLAAGVPVFDIRDEFGTTDMLICDCVRGDALARTLGDKSVALLRGHGSIACGPTLQMAVFRAVFTEVNARIQHWTTALAGGGPIAALSMAEGVLADVPNEGGSLRAWELWRTQIRAQTQW
jgi:ribulose-5-phosphate 4-epimerase/fuculose-1-phosphate aldolase